MDIGGLGCPGRAACRSDPSEREEKQLSSLTDNMTFGTFMAPFHRVGENPTLALERDLELIEWLDDLGFDEAWSASITAEAGRP